MTKSNSELTSFFYPKHVAVFGVSREESNLGQNIVLNCLRYRFDGEILPIGQREGFIFGQKIVTSLNEMDREIDLAVILTPAKTIPGILEECGLKGVKSVVIESSGFSEIGAEGKPLEKACLEIAEKYGIRIIGPNGLGIVNLENGLALPFFPLRKTVPRGSVSILTQSGGVGLTYLQFLAEENIGVNKFVSMGNKSDVNENELLHYLINDEGTRIILVYLEGFTDGRRFLEIASHSEKPILVLKANRSQASARIAYSHTAALFADDKLVTHALQQVGCIRINTLEDAVDYIKSLALPPLTGNRLAVVCRSGGHAVLATDACDFYGFELPAFPEGFLKKFESRFRAHVIQLQNPLDLGDLFEHEFYEVIIDEILKRDEVDGLVLGHGYRQGYEQEASRAMLKTVESLIEKYHKPVALFVLTDDVERNFLKTYLNIPVFSVPENAMRSLSLSREWVNRSMTLLEMPPSRDVDKEEAGLIIKNTPKGNDLLLSEALELISQYGIPVPEHRLARSADEALEAARSFNAPVALKINRPGISHKSDQDAVQLNLESESQILNTFDHLQAIVGESIEVLVQPMVEEGREVIIGGKWDPVFGPVILFGLGGIFVEALEDISWRVAPIDYDIARQMIQSIRGIKILNGIRGETPYDIASLENLLVRLSWLLMDFPEILEIDINPVFVLPEGNGAQAVDARVIMKYF